MINNLKAIRESRQLSQSQLAKLANIKLRTLQHYEQGSNDINSASLYKLLNLSIALKCSVSDIITDEELLNLIKRAKFK